MILFMLMVSVWAEEEKLNVDKSDSMINDNLKIFMYWILNAKPVNISNYKEST